MKLLFDENLSRDSLDRLTSHLKVWSALEIGRSGSSQRPRIFIIVTVDADFYELVTAYGPPPKVIRLRSWQYPTAVVEQILRSNAVRISEFVQDAERGLLILAS